ncbi:hypothetical protein RB601_009430 [Gaeumannomyces tritici]
MGEIAHTLRFNPKFVSKQQFDRELDHRMGQVLELALETLADSDLSGWTARLAEVLSAKQHSLGSRDWEQICQDGAAYLCTLLTSNGSEKQAKQAELADLISLGSTNGVAEEFAALARDYCFNRTFLVTCTRKMGIGPASAEVGDTITVLLGGDIPFVTRRQGNSWAFVGGAYIQGLMDGEAIAAWKQGDVSKTVFEIQ